MKTDVQNPFRWVSLFRIIAISVILGIGIYFLPKDSTIPLWIIITITYILTFTYYIAFKKEKLTNFILWISIILDTFIITGVIHYTGGIQSEFYFLYFFPVIVGSIFFFLRGGVFIATFSILPYATLLLLEYHKIIPMIFPLSQELDPYTLYMRLYLQATFFYLVAVTSGYLAEQLRRKGKEVEQVKLDTSTILQSINSGIIVIDHLGNLLYKNESAEQILKTPIHKNIKELPDEFAKLLNDNFKKGFQEINIGSKVIGVNTSWLQNTRGEQRGIVLIFQDLTDSKITERLATIGSFSGDLAHEIRNPVAALQGSSELIKEGVSKTQREKLINNIISQSERLNTIVTNFLSFTKPTPLNLESVEIGEIINESIELANIDKIPIEFIQNQKTPKNLQLTVDREQIKTVFSNLIINALQSMNSSKNKGYSIQKLILEIISPSHKYSIFEEQMTTNSDEAVIIFQDSGPGIPDHELQQVFTPFYTTRKGGTGLGLSIVSKIVESHKGRVEVKSKLGKGSCFIIHLPYKTQKDKDFQ